MAGKKLFNKVDTVVDDALEGLVAIHPGLRLLENHRVVVREHVNKNKVAILSGGGSGHEPFCAGYIGSGMLTAGVAGSVFASPPTSSILAGIRAIAKDNPEGALVLVINYTGDRINFGLATEKARQEGMKVEMFVNGEDCALTSADKSAGRRGLCGTMFIFKIAGAMAEAGLDLSTIVSTVKTISSSMGTMGLALGPCSLPGSGPLFSVAEDQIEIGLGVHGENGVGQMPLGEAKDAVKRLLDHMTKPSSATRMDLRPGEKLAVLLNNLGGTSKLEELILSKELVGQLEARGYQVVRVYTGHLMTSLEMAGILISLLKVTDHPDWLPYLDAPTSAPAWPTVLQSSSGATRQTPARVPVEKVEDNVAMQGPKLGEEGGNKVKQALGSIVKSIQGMEQRLNELDSGCGDGDCGSTLAAGATAIGNSLDKLPTLYPLALLQQLGIMAESMGGTSGGIYSLFFTSGAQAFQEEGACADKPAAWVKALRCGIDAVIRYGGAEPGDRTMLDALYPALMVLEEQKDKLAQDPASVLKQAAAAAKKGAMATSSMKAKAGRASYVAQDKVNAVDPGAEAAAEWFSQIAQVF